MYIHTVYIHICIKNLNTLKQPKLVIDHLITDNRGSMLIISSSYDSRVRTKRITDKLVLMGVASEVAARHWLRNPDEGGLGGDVFQRGETGEDEEEEGEAEE